ncbi:UPF0111 protein TC_0063 [Chlamydiales bacterium SCGC AB-751-O23]|jgi:uncharacterized protein|nr:UPF0111 protein TC_0063 [Chlamydiales bacterium SCGC AB-751-O23]
MRILANIFGKSPFSLLESHMEKVSDCVKKLPEILAAFKNKDKLKVEELSKEISKLEHYADITKNDIRNNLPTSMFLPIDRASLLEILGLQDSIADKAEDIGILLTFRTVDLPDDFFEEIEEFLQKNIECFLSSHKVINELDELLEFSFGGVEADKVRTMVEEVAYQEHQVDIIQRKILKRLFNDENEVHYASFSLLQMILKEMASISNMSEKLANRIRMTLEVK